jgi:hypothetical protein
VAYTSASISISPQRSISLGIGSLCAEPMRTLEQWWFSHERVVLWVVAPVGMSCGLLKFAIIVLL